MPGTGKSTIMKKLMGRIGQFEQEKLGEQLWTEKCKNIRILGKYDEGETFSGTDRLSMSVCPEAIHLAKQDRDEVWIGEGDRLNNKGFFESVEDKTIIYLTVSDKERHRRYEERGSNQSREFINTCKTKIKNIVNQFGDVQTLWGEEKGCVVEMRHETPFDTDKIVDEILKMV